MNNEEKNINPQESLRLAVYVRERGVDILTVKPDGAEISTLEVDRTITSPTKIIEEAVYSAPALLGAYSRVDVVGGFDRFVIAPDQTDPDTVAAKLWTDEERNAAVLTVDPCFGGAKFISLADRSLEGFVGRTFGRAELHNRLALLVNFFAGLSRPVNRVKMYAHLTGESGLDIIALTADGLLMANSFRCQDANDVVYFIMASVEDCGFDALDDELILCGDRDRCTAVTDTLRQYLNSVMPLLLPDGDASSPLELLIFKK